MKTITKIEPAARPESKKLKVAAYCRVSTGTDAQLESLEVQREHYDSFIKEHDDWEFAGLYYDEGITGTKKEVRADLMRMIEDCRDGRIDYILTKSISRFSRNRIDCLTMVRELLGLGIGIYFEKENLDTKTMNDEFLLTVLSSVAEMESQSISTNEKWSYQKKMANGTFRQGSIPYGYRLSKEGMVVDPEKAEAVRWMFRMALEGAGPKKIANALNAKGIQAPKSARWYESTVRKLLRNERYIGDCLFQKTFTDDSFKKHINRGEVNQYYVENHHKPLISREDFEKVQELFGKRATGRSTSGKRKVHTFTRKLKCGECGHYLNHRTVYGRNEGPYDAWYCGTHTADTSKCSLKEIPQEALENSFTTMLNKLIFSRKTLAEPFAKAVKRTSIGDDSARFAEIEQELDDNIAKDQTIANLAAAGVLDAGAFVNARAELNARRQKLSEEKDMLKRRIAKGSKTKEEAIRLPGILEHLEIDTEFNPEAFNELVGEVTVNSRESVSFCLKCGLVLTEEVKTR